MACRSFRVAPLLPLPADFQNPPHVQPGGGADLARQLVPQSGSGLGPVVGFRQVVDRAAIQRVQRDVRPQLGQRADHDHRNGPPRQDRVQRRQAVHVGHLDVQRDHVRPERVENLQRLPAVAGRADHLHAGRGGDAVGDDRADHRRIVDHQDANVLRRHERSLAQQVAGTSVPYETAKLPSGARRDGPISSAKTRCGIIPRLVAVCCGRCMKPGFAPRMGQIWKRF